METTMSRKGSNPRSLANLKRGGQQGRTKGTPNKVTQEVREVARQLVEGRDYRAALQAKLDAGKLHPAVETMLWHYAYGKPKETVQVEGGLEVLRVVIEK
jgi:hypothetical protein